MDLLRQVPPAACLAWGLLRMTYSKYPGWAGNSQGDLTSGSPGGCWHEDGWEGSMRWSIHAARGWGIWVEDNVAVSLLPSAP